jgi:predicted DsbA family dithiol-disulfide isomerase
VKIEIVSDVICPWCYIGRRRLAKALELAPDVQVEITWLPFQLNPGMPREGMPRAEYRKAKFGSVERGRELDARVAGEGRGEGIAFAFERMQRTPNTVAAHRLIAAAQKEGKGQAAVDALFKAYFENAEDIGDPAVLEKISSTLGIRGEVDEKEVAALEASMRGLGIQAVPTFIFDRKFGVSGAHPPEALAQAMREAAAG